MEKLRVGFIGVGRVTDLHYLGYKDNPKAELHAVCSADSDLLQQRVKHHFKRVAVRFVPIRSGGHCL